MQSNTHHSISSDDSPLDIRSRILGESSVILYGVGSVGRESLAMLQRFGLVVRAFIDAKDSTCTSIHGIQVLKPDSPVFSCQERRETTVIVTIFNAYVDMSVIHARLSDLGWAKVVIYTEFYQAFAVEIGNRYWLTAREYYRSFENQIAAVRALLVDEKSRSVFDGIMRFRLSGDYACLEDVDMDDQYFPSDVPPWKLPLRLADCGAFDGDTFRKIKGLGHSLEAYAAFEPDPENFEKLAAGVVQLSDDTRSLFEVLWPCGAWSHVCQLRFASGQGSGCAVDLSGNTVVQCVPLDQALASFRPTLIKMDIEGAEYPALLGAAKIIRRHRPGLAICLYHEPSHLWQIPLLIANWNLEYRFYLRCHCYNGFDLVLYAIPA